MSLKRYNENDVEPYNRRGLNSNDIQYGLNMARHMYDYATNSGDFAASGFKKQNTGSEEIMEADSTTNENNNGNATNTANPMAMSSGSASGVGYRGILAGRTATNLGWEKYYHERNMFHSFKKRSYDYVWGLSKWFRPDHFGVTPYSENNRLRYYSSSVPALPIIDNSQSAITGTRLNPFRPTGAWQGSWADQIYAQPIDITIGDLWDNKLFRRESSGTPIVVTLKGLMTSYRKIRLKSFTINITPKTYVGTIWEQYPEILTNAEFEALPEQGEHWFFNTLSAANQRVSNDQHEIDCDYWILRDINGYFMAGDQTWATVPDDSKPSSTGPDKIPRTARVIRAFDNNLTIMSNKKPFSFTREIAPIGNYYLTPQNLDTDRNKSVHIYVNELEGQSGSTTLVNKLPEYFGMLFCPINPPMKTLNHVPWKRDGNRVYYGDMPLVSIYTKLHVKIEAKWECFDYDHIANAYVTQSTKIIDPYESAELDYKAQIVLSKNKVNAGLDP